MTGAITPFKYYQTSGKVDRVVIHTYTQVPVHTVNNWSQNHILKSDKNDNKSVVYWKTKNEFFMLG